MEFFDHARHLIVNDVPLNAFSPLYFIIGLFINAIFMSLTSRVALCQSSSRTFSCCLNSSSLLPVKKMTSFFLSRSVFAAVLPKDQFFNFGCYLRNYLFCYNFVCFSLRLSIHVPFCSLLFYLPVPVFGDRIELLAEIEDVSNSVPLDKRHLIFWRKFRTVLFRV